MCEPDLVAKEKCKTNNNIPEDIEYFYNHDVNIKVNFFIIITVLIFPEIVKLK